MKKANFLLFYLFCIASLLHAEQSIEHNAADNTLAQTQNSTIHFYADTLKQVMVENPQLAKNSLMLPLDLSLGIAFVWFLRNHNGKDNYHEVTNLLLPFLHTVFGNYVKQMGAWWLAGTLHCALFARNYVHLHGYNRPPCTEALVASTIAPMIVLVHIALPDLFYAASLAGLEGIKTLTEPTYANKS